MKVRFNLNGNRIYLVFRYGAERPFRASTGHEVARKHWNTKTGRARASWPGYLALNGFLDRLEQAVSDVQLAAARDGRRLAVGELQAAIAPHLSKRTEKQQQVTLLSFVEDWIAEREKSKRVAAGTIRNYRATFSRLGQYGKRYTEPDFRDIGPAFLARFVAFLYALPGRGGKPSEQSMVSAHVSRIKIFMNEATERGYNSNMAFRAKSFRVASPRADKVYLTVDELLALHGLDLAAAPDLERVRDLALIGAFTGQRFSDFSRISSEHIYQTKEGDRLRIRTVKSGRKREVIAPVHPLLRAVLDKYAGRVPVMRNEYMNRKLKVLCQMAGITHTLPVTKHAGGVPRETLVEKWKLVSAHTLRRTFITNALAAGLPAGVVMDVVGISQINTLMRYNVIEAERSAQIVQASDFFRGDRFLRAL